MLWTVPAIAKESGKSMRHVRRVLASLGIEPEPVALKGGSSRRRLIVSEPKVGAVLERLSNGRRSNYAVKSKLPGEPNRTKRKSPGSLPWAWIQIADPEPDPVTLRPGDTTLRERLLADGRCLACLDDTAKESGLCGRCLDMIRSIDQRQRRSTRYEAHDGALNPWMGVVA